MKPEEKLARNLLRRHEIKSPPFDLQRLSSVYAEIEYLPFPNNSDGVVLGIGEREKPEILINSNKPRAKQIFTLAHELGHILIPWHTGGIISTTDIGRIAEAEWIYRECEREANRFSAELLMPSSWIQDSYNAVDNIESLILKVMRETGVSIDAILIKLFSVIDSPIILFEMMASDKHQKYSTPKAPRVDNMSLLRGDESKIPLRSEWFRIRGRSFGVFYFDLDSVSFSERDERQWREILNEILLETGLADKGQNVNGVLAAAFGRCYRDGISVDEVCREVLQSFVARTDLASFTNHSLFEEYVVKRVVELIKRRTD